MELKVAVRKNDLNEVTRLIEQGCDLSYRNYTCIRTAARRGYTEIFKFLSQYIDPTVKDNYCLKKVTCNGHVGILELLIKDKRIDITWNHNYALRWTAHNGHYKCFMLLYSLPQVGVNDWSNEAVRWSCTNGHDKIVEVLLKDKRVDPSQYDNEALFYAAKRGHYNVIKLLLQHILTRIPTKAIRLCKKSVLSLLQSRPDLVYEAPPNPYGLDYADEY